MQIPKLFLIFATLLAKFQVRMKLCYDTQGQGCRILVPDIDRHVSYDVRNSNVLFSLKMQVDYDEPGVAKTLLL
jgi:hypothetical protein